MEYQYGTYKYLPPFACFKVARYNSDWEYKHCLLIEPYHLLATQKAMMDRVWEGVLSLCPLPIYTPSIPGQQSHLGTERSTY